MTPGIAYLSPGVLRPLGGLGAMKAPGKVGSVTARFSPGCPCTTLQLWSLRIGKDRATDSGTFLVWSGEMGVGTRVCPGERFPLKSSTQRPPAEPPTAQGLRALRCLFGGSASTRPAASALFLLSVLQLGAVDRPHGRLLSPSQPQSAWSPGM